MSYKKLTLHLLVGFIIAFALCLWMLSKGMGLPLWQINADPTLPIIMALCLSSLLVASVYGYVIMQGRIRRLAAWSILYVLLIILTLYIANLAYLWWRGYPLTYANPFRALWLADFVPDLRLLQIQFILGVSIITIGLPTVIILIGYFQANNKKGAHFQTRSELIKNGHTNPVGFPIGKDSGLGNTMYWVDTVAMTILAVTESFKTSALILPALFTFPGSSISTDIKSELWKKSKAFFQANNVDIYRWILFGDGTEEHYARINPFFYVPWKTLKANSFLRMITRALVPLLKEYEDTIWEQAARDTVMAIATHLYLESNDPNNVTLPKIIDLVAEPTLFDDIKSIYEKHSDNPQYGKHYKNWIAKLVAVDDNKLKNNLIYSIQKNVSNLFEPAVLHAMNGNDVDLRTLRKKRSAIFVDVPVGRSDEVEIFLNLFYNLVMGVVSDMGEHDKNKEPYQLLLNMEEFADMGNIKKLAQGANTYRSFGVRFIFVLQNSGQLADLYGNAKTKTFLSSGVLIKGGDNNHDDNVFFSDLLGEKRVVRYEGKEKNRRKIVEWRRLMTADEIRVMSSKYWLIVKQGEPAMKLRKLWDEKDFKEELELALPLSERQGKPTRLVNSLGLLARYRIKQWFGKTN